MKSLRFKKVLIKNINLELGSLIKISEYDILVNTYLVT